MPWLTNTIKTAAKKIAARILGKEVSVAGGDSAWGWEEDLDPVSMRSAYKKMVHDPAVKAALLTMLLEVCALDLKVIPADAEKEEEKEVADFVRHALTSLMGGSTKGLLMKIAKPALVHQFSISEMVFKTEERGAFKGKWTLSALKSKDITTGLWGFTLDAFRNVEAITQTVNGERRSYSPDKFINYAFLPDFENPRSTSHLRAAYRAWWVKRIVLRSWAFHAEKSGVVPVGRYASASQKAALEKQLKKFSGRKWVSLPKDVELELVTWSKGETEINFERLLRVLDKQIFLSIRGAFLQALEGDRTGARSMGEVHETTADLFVWYLAFELADVLNEQVVPWLVSLNYGPDRDLPKVSLEAPVQEDLKIRAEIVDILVKAGLPLSKQELYEEFGFSPPKDEEDEVKKAPVPASPFGGGPGGSPFERGGNGEEEEEEEELTAVEEEEWWDDFITHYDRERSRSRR